VVVVLQNKIYVYNFCALLWDRKGSEEKP